MTDIKELVDDLVMGSTCRDRNMKLDYVLLCTRFLAAYLAEQKPRGWWNPSYPALSIQLTKPYDGGGWEPFFTAPPLPEPAPDWLLKTTQNLALHMAKEFFPDVPQFKVLDDLAGVISQIDNMVCGLPREPIADPEPAPQMPLGDSEGTATSACAAQLQDQVENLAALVNRLCRQVNKFDSGNAVAVAASKYIFDNDLIGTSLRKDDEGIRKIIDMVNKHE